MAYNSDKPGSFGSREKQRGGARGASYGRSDRREFGNGTRRHPFIHDSWDEEAEESRSRRSMNSREFSSDRRSGYDREKRSSFSDRQRPWDQERNGNRFSDQNEESFSRRNDRRGSDRKENRFSDRFSERDGGRTSNREYRFENDRRENRSGSFPRSGFGSDDHRFQRNDRSRFENRTGNRRDFDRSSRSGERRPDGPSFGSERGDRHFTGNSDRRFRPGFNEFRNEVRHSRQEKGYNVERHNENASKKEEGYIRLNRYIANAGICSRREADQMILSGAITVNGEVCSTLGTLVGPNDRVQFGGQTLNAEKKVYILMNKPKGYITTSDDPQERKTVMDLLHGACKERIYPVGRLDRNTTGVLLFTNDGEIAKRLTHPSHGARKIYHVTLDNPLSKSDLASIARGVMLEDGYVEVDDITYVESGNRKEIGIQIHSGKNRVVRRIFEKFGYTVTKLDRVLFAELTKKDLSRGKWRFLDEKEISFLKMNAGTKKNSPKTKQPVFTEEQLAEAAAIEDAPVSSLTSQEKKTRKKVAQEEEWTGDEDFIQPRPSVEISDEDLDKILASIDFDDVDEDED